MNVRIEGEKIILRSVDSSDIDTILLWENSSAEPLYGVYEETFSREDVVQFIENQQRFSLAENEQLRLMICSHEGERLFQQCKIANERGRFAVRRILSQGNEIDVFLLNRFCDI